MELTKEQINKVLVKQASKASEAQPPALALCAVSGISFAFPSLPQVAGLQALVIESPLKRWPNVQGYCRQPHGWLAKQQGQFLAGLILAGFRHWSLLDLGEGNAIEANLVLAQASQASLVQIVQWLGKFNKQTAAGLPALIVQWGEVKNEHFNATSFLQAYIQRLRPYFDAEHKAMLRIEEIRKGKTDEVMDMSLLRMGRALAGGQYLSAQQTYKAQQAQVEADIKQAKAMIKQALASQGQDWLQPKLRNLLRTVSQGHNIVAMHQGLRQKLVERLQELGQQELAQAIAKAQNPHDIFAKASQELDRASDSFGQAEGQGPCSQGNGRSNGLANSQAGHSHAGQSNSQTASQATGQASAQPMHHGAKSIKELLAMRKAAGLESNGLEASNTPKDF